MGERTVETRQSKILAALDEACRDEVGGWATPLPVAEILAINPSAASVYLRQCVTEGLVEAWQPRGGKNKVTWLYRVSFLGVRDE